MKFLNLEGPPHDGHSNCNHCGCFIVLMTKSRGKPSTSNIVAHSTRNPVPATWVAEVNQRIRNMRCSRCGTDETPTYRIEGGKEIISCCCDTFLLDLQQKINGSPFILNGQTITAEISISGRIKEFGRDKAHMAIHNPTSRSQESPRERHVRPSLRSEPQLRITYVDANGNETVREISDLRYSNSYYFKAYCHLRQEERTFCPDRIKEACDLKTGEIVDTIHVRYGDKGKTRTFNVG